MRPELNIHEKIDHYLSGQLSAEEKTQFEAQIKADQNLAELVENQRLLIKAVQRKAIRADIQKYGGKGGFNWMNFSLITLGIIGLITALFLYFSSINKSTSQHYKESRNITPLESNETTEITEPVHVENIITDSTDTSEETNTENQIKKSDKTNKNFYAEDTECGGHPTFVTPDYQHFVIDPKESTTIEGKDGMIIFIPKNAFVDETGNEISEAVNLELVEALNLKEMVLYDLPTLSNDKMLESGGMFYISATSNGKEVKINPKRPFYIEVPTDSLRPNMRVFKGDVLADGSINWINPQKMKKYLTKIPLKDLDFLPEGFEDAVTKVLPINNHTINNKELTDSLYYSLLNENITDDYVSNNQPDSTQDLSKLRNKERRGFKFAIGRGFGLRSKQLPRNSDYYVTGYTYYNGAPIKATVNLQYENTKFAPIGTTSSKNGRFFIKYLPTGKYTLSINSGDYYDSLFYYTANIEVADKPLNLGNIQLQFSNVVNGVIDGGMLYANQNVQKTESSSVTSNNDSLLKCECGLDPSSVKTIKQSNFENTFIATKEFEERIFWLHKLDNGQEILELYINNLTKDLSYSDSLAMKKINDETVQSKFVNFYNQHCTNIEDASIYQEELTAYYQKKRSDFHKETVNLQKQLDQKNINELKVIQDEIDKKVNEYKTTANYSTVTSSNKWGATKRIPKISIPSISISRKYQESAPATTYAFNWSETGWSNIDQYIHLLSQDPDKNQLVKINIKDYNNYNLCKSYQWLNEINTLNPISVSNGNGTIPFPPRSSGKSEQMKNSYNFVLAKKRGEFYYQYSQFDPYTTESIASSPQKITKQELETTLENLGAGNLKAIKHFDQVYQSIEDEIKRKEKMEQLMAEQKALQAEKDKLIAKRREVENKINLLKSVAFKCFRSEGNKAIGIPMPSPTEPEFIGNNGDLNGYLMDKLTKMKRPEIFSAEVNFTVDEKGKVQNVVIDTKDQLPKFFIKGLKDMFESMPNWKPATENGKPVSYDLTLPLGAKGEK